MQYKRKTANAEIKYLMFLFFIKEQYKLHIQLLCEVLKATCLRMRALHHTAYPLTVVFT